MGLLSTSLVTLLSFSPALQAGEDDSKQPALTGWVSELYSNHPQTRLVDLVLPGTHDSGSYAITSSSPPAPGAPEVYSKFSRVTAAWAKTQDKTLEQQLNDGVRYLDLRVAKHEDRLVLVHGLVSCTLREALEGVHRFARAHPREPVLLDLQAMPSRAAHDELHALFQEVLGDHLFAGKGPPSEWTLQELWKVKRALIAIVDHANFAAREPEYRSRRCLDSVWTNSRTVEVLRERLDSRLRSRDRDSLQCAYLTFTPELEAIVADQIFGARGLASFSEPLFELPGKWIPRWLDEDLRPNVVSVDFYDRTDVVSAVIAANQRLLAP